MSRMDDLASVLTERTVEGPAAAYLRQGVVASVDATTATVGLRLGGSTVVLTGVHYLAAYTPTVGDVVMCLRAGGDLLVLGAIASV